MDLTTLTIKELSEKLRKKETSSVEATKAYLKRIEAVEGKVHAFVTVTPDEELAMADDDPADLRNLYPAAVAFARHAETVSTDDGSGVNDGIPADDATRVYRDIGM